ncbi:MAG: hypothetical protein QM715_20055 [Nibricoccus sp.]
MRPTPSLTGGRFCSDKQLVDRDVPGAMIDVAGYSSPSQPACRDLALHQQSYFSGPSALNHPDYKTRSFPKYPLSLPSKFLELAATTTEDLQPPQTAK